MSMNQRKTGVFKRACSILLCLTLLLAYMPSRVLAMQISVEMTIDDGQKHIILEVEPTDRVEDIKQRISDENGTIIENQTLLFAGKVLKNGNTLQDYSIQKDSTIRLINARALDISEGNVTITETGYSVGDDAETAYSGQYVIYGDTNQNTLTVSGGTHNIFLASLNMRFSKSGDLFRIEDGNVFIDSLGENILQATSDGGGSAIAMGDSAVLHLGGTGHIKLVGASNYHGGSHAVSGGILYVDNGEVTLIGGRKIVNSYGHAFQGNALFVTGGTLYCGVGYLDNSNYSEPTVSAPIQSFCGTLKRARAHNLVYSENGTMIVEGCVNDCGHYATAFLSAEDAVYNGSAITAATVNFSDNWTGSMEHSEISYSNNTDVGNATAKATVASKELTATFKINPATITDEMVNLSPTSETYNGSAYTPSISVTFNGAPLAKDRDYNISWDKDGFTTPDTYTVRVEGINNFTGSVDKTFTINAANLSDIKVEQVGTLTYNGSEQTPTISTSATSVNNQKITLTYSTEQNGTYDENLPTFKEAGSYTVFFKVTAPNHNEETGKFTVKVNKATNEWTTDPYISDYAYRESPSNLQGTSKFGKVTVTYAGIANQYDRVYGPSLVPPFQAGKYTATFKVDGTANYTGLEEVIHFTVERGENIRYLLVVASDETVSGKGDGKINGLKTTMEISTDGTNYAAITESDISKNYAAGTYYVRYAGNDNYKASKAVTVTVAAGRMLTVTVPATQTGYTISAAHNELEWNGTTTLTFNLKEGYSRTSAFAVKVNGNAVELDANNQYVITNAQENIVITVEGVADTTPPTAEIVVRENQWTGFWNNLTVGLFFNDTQDVAVSAADAGSGVKSIEYYLASGELTEDEVKEITEWVEYNGTFKIDPNNRYVIYAKVTDNAGNTVYVNSDGIILDNIAPTLEGIENGKTYYGDLTVIKPDEQIYDIKTVALDGEPMGFAEGTYGLIPADNAEHTVVVEDHAGNKTTYTVSVMKNYTVTYKADGVTISTQTVGHGKDAAAPAIPEKEGYTQTAPVWDKDGMNITADTDINAVYTINKYTVTYKADGAVINTVEVEYGKDVVAPTVPAKEGYTAAWDKDGKNITEDTTITAVYTAIPAADTDKPGSPQTGDNTNVGLYFGIMLLALLGLVITALVGKRYRRKTN